MFLINQEETVNFANANSKGSTMPYAVWNDTLENMHIIIPTEKEITKYFNLIIPMLNKISGNIIQSQSLEEARNTLLPKLMKGEIRINKM
ncbi:MAG: hypothetical protein MRY57_01000 [Candidatus Pacebacteria bacterium]|nr:hypothetical protein [Candidatus Paceibacterota bacterium]